MDTFYVKHRTLLTSIPLTMFHFITVFDLAVGFKPATSN